MTSAEYAALVRGLPLPTPEQYEAFAWHVCTAHSWYKHLSMLHGAEFVVFVSPRAGGGNLVARLLPEGGFTLEEPETGPRFTEEHPRLHHTWKTTAEYRERFGYLDYAWRDGPDDGWGGDGGNHSDVLPDELRERWSFRLYPYASPECPEVIEAGIHAEALRLLEAGFPHPCREQVLAWRRLHDEDYAAWCRLSDEDQDRALDLDDHEGPLPDDLSPDIREYLDAAARLREVIWALCDHEEAKVKSALASLDAWLREIPRE